MVKNKTPVTAATRCLDQAKRSYTPYVYTYEKHGGTRVSARELKVEEHHVIKTLVMTDELSNPFIVLMHGDMDVSTKQMARTIKVKSTDLCRPEQAQKYTGYQVVGTSPFGTRKKLPVYMEKSIEELETIYINGGKRGFLIGLSPQILIEILKPIPVRVGIKPTVPRPQQKS
jgi:Cys-tRNA(Pro) deacylase